MPKVNDIRALIDRTQVYLPSDTLALIEDAYELASQVYLAAESSKPYLEHSLETAITIAELQLDEQCITAALLHELPTLCGMSLDEITRRFGNDVAKLVEGLVKLGKLSGPSEVKQKRVNVDVEAHAESMRKMLMALADDVRVVFIKLADQLIHMRHLRMVPPAKRRAMARETVQVYAPIAHRLGIWQIQWQLEDLAFRYLSPAKYREITHFVTAGREEREKYIAQVL